MTNDNKIINFIGHYLANRPLFFAFLRPTEAWLFHQQKRLINGKILDFGCGDGFFASLLFGKKGVDVGLDVYQSRIRLIEKSSVYQKTVAYDGLVIPFKNNSFDTVISNSVLEHIKDLQVNLKQINRILKKDGKFLCTVMLDKWEKNLLGYKLFGTNYTNYVARIQVHYHLYSVAKWQKQFEQAGFRVTSAQSYLPASLVKAVELAHLFSFFSLVTFKVFKKWVLFPNWYRWLRLDQWIEKRLKDSLLANKHQGACAFFILEKK